MRMETKQTNLAKAAAPIFAALLSKPVQGRHYMSVADTAKLVRAALKDAFPAVKFSVRSSSYSGGASIRIAWVDGPTTEEVDRVAKPYEGADFDGSIDLKSYSTAWLSPTGVASVAHAQGTEGSRGCHPEIIGSPNHPNAVEVHFGADFIHTDREFSLESKQAALAQVLARYGDSPELTPRPEYVEKASGSSKWFQLSNDPRVSRAGEWLSVLINRHLYKQTLSPVSA